MSDRLLRTTLPVWIILAVVGGSTAQAECLYRLGIRPLCHSAAWCLDRELGHCTDPYNVTPLSTAGHVKGDFARQGGHFYLFDGAHWHIMPQDAPPDDRPPDEN